MEDLRLFLCLVIAVPFLGQHMNNHRLLQFLDVLQRMDQARQIMSVNRPIIAEAQRFEKTTLLLVNKQGFDGILHPFDAVGNRPANQRDPLQAAADSGLGILPTAGSSQIRQITAQSADILGNGHLVVVKDHDQPCFAVPGVVQRFVAHAARHGAVTHQGNHLMGLPQLVTGTGHSQRSGDRGGGMAGFEGVIFAFAALGEAGNAAIRAQGMKFVTAARQELVYVTLMAHIKDQLVLGHIKNPVQGKGQLHHTQVGGQMSAFAGNGRYQFGADLASQVIQLIKGKSFENLG